jgi:hypothetical protein
LSTGLTGGNFLTIREDKDQAEEWVPKAEFPEDVSRIPAGRNVVGGVEKYVDGNGDEFTRDQYIARHKVDPKPLWDEIQSGHPAAVITDGVPPGSGGSSVPKPDGFPESVKRVPAGKIVKNGQEVYFDGDGNELTRDEYMAKYHVDPEPLWDDIQKQLGLAK